PVAARPARGARTGVARFARATGGRDAIRLNRRRPRPRPAIPRRAPARNPGAWRPAQAAFRRPARECAASLRHHLRPWPPWSNPMKTANARGHALALATALMAACTAAAAADGDVARRVKALDALLAEQ